MVIDKNQITHSYLIQVGDFCRLKSVMTRGCLFPMIMYNVPIRRWVHRFILCLNYMMLPLVLYPPSFEAVYCYICGRRRVICLVLVFVFQEVV